MGHVGRGYTSEYGDYNPWLNGKIWPRSSKKDAFIAKRTYPDTEAPYCEGDYCMGHNGRGYTSEYGDYNPWLNGKIWPRASKSAFTARRAGDGEWGTGMLGGGEYTDAYGDYNPFLNGANLKKPKAVFVEPAAEEGASFSARKVVPDAYCEGDYCMGVEGKKVSDKNGGAKRWDYWTNLAWPEDK